MSGKAAHENAQDTADNFHHGAEPVKHLTD
jgi:hypothetical protein